MTRRLRKVGKRDEHYATCTTADDRPGECRPSALCVGLTPREEDSNACRMRGSDDDASGICCNADDDDARNQRGSIAFAPPEEAGPDVRNRVSVAEVERILLR